MSYESALAVCPYYQRDEGAKILCAGMPGAQSCYHQFCCSKAASRYRNQHCRSLTGWQDCPWALTVRFEEQVVAEEVKKIRSP